MLYKKKNDCSIFDFTLICGFSIPVSFKKYGESVVDGFSVFMQQKCV